MRRKWRRILRLHHLQQGSVGHLPHTVKWTDRTSSLELPSRWPSALWWNEPENRIVVHQFIYYTTAIWISLSSFSRLWDWCARQWLRDHRRTCHWWWRWQRACCEVQHQGRSNFAAQIAGTKIPSRMRILLWSEQRASKFQYYGIIVDIVDIFSYLLHPDISGDGRLLPGVRRIRRSPSQHWNSLPRCIPVGARAHWRTSISGKIYFWNNTWQQVDHGR